MAGHPNPGGPNGNRRRLGASLDATRRQAEDEKARYIQHSTFTTGVLDLLMNHDEIQGPTTLADAAKLMGQNERRVRDFEEKWGGKEPPGFTPEADAYHAELAGIANGYAAILKTPRNAGDDINATGAQGTSQYPVAVQLQAGVFASALNLDEAQAQQVSSVLGGLYSPDFEHATAEQRKATAQSTYDSLLSSAPRAKRRLRPHLLTRLLPRHAPQYSLGGSAAGRQRRVPASEPGTPAVKQARISTGRSNADPDPPK